MSTSETVDALAFARAFVELYEDGGFDGVIDEISYDQFQLSLRWSEKVEAARHFIEHTRAEPMADLQPMDAFPDHVQDLGNVLYDVEQAPRERYVDYAQRVVDALGAEGYTIVRTERLHD